MSRCLYHAIISHYDSFRLNPTAGYRALDTINLRMLRLDALGLPKIPEPGTRP